ncbi:hypothetical protein ACFX13_015901 [Malus domestica]
MLKQLFRTKHTLVVTSHTSTATTSRPLSSSSSWCSSSPVSDSTSTILNRSSGAFQLRRCKTRIANPSPRFHLPKTQLHTHLKPPKANQTLKTYLKSNSATKALLLFRDILRTSPATTDSYTLLFVLKACTQKSVSLEGKQMHALVLKYGFESIVYLQTSLMNMYSAAGDVVDAHLVFDEIPSKNIVCWTTLVSAYVDNQKPNEALQLFRQMQMHNVEPDQVTLTVALSACADLGALEMGEWINAYVCHKYGFDTDLCLNNALVNMYAKCGDIGTARRLFYRIREKDVMTWTSMIVGHALHGQAEEALTLFGQMKEASKNTRKNKRNGDFESGLVVPNHVTFIGVLMACSHAGMVEEGKWHFRSMSQEYGLKPREAHFGCMVDLFCRAGLLQDAYDFILKMTGPSNAVMWRTLLGACSLHGDIKLGSQVRVKLLELEPTYAGDDVTLSNIYAAKGMWDRKMVVRDQMKQRRPPGCSSIEVGRSISEFVSADDDHPLRTEIYEILRQLIATAAAKSPQLSSNPTPFLAVMESGELQRVGVVQRVPLLIVNFVAGALVLLFALGGIAGALAGKASDSGVVRGAGLGAVAGAVLSVEILEASRDLLCLGRPGARRSSLMAEITEELICWRFEEVNLATSEVVLANQVSLANLRHDVYGGAETRGLSRNVLNKLPSHVVLKDTKAARGCCCTICLQDVEVGEIARTLPLCQHTFHLACVDKWLSKHASCPLCRRDV